jgi:hypothetical protein
MLKKIFKRNRKGYKKKKTKSKSNKLNITTDDISTNANSLSFVGSGPAMDDEEEDEIDLPKLNFSCILNNPLEDINNTSIFGQLLMKFQEDLRVVTEEERLKKEGYKFDLIDIIQDRDPKLTHNNSFVLENKMLNKMVKEEEEENEELDDILTDLEQLDSLFSTKKTIEQCIKETNEELYKGKKTFKLMKVVDLSYKNYIAKIKHEYLMYKDYHKKNIMSKILEDLLEEEKDTKFNKKEIFKPGNIYRNELNSMNIIDKEYIVDTKDFKIKNSLLNMDTSQIMECIAKIIEQKGKIELEAEKSNINYNVIKYFFKNNYPLLINEVDNVQFKINNLIEKKNNLKNKFLDTTQKMILMKIKRQNLIKLLEIYKKMKLAKCHNLDNINTIIEIREMKQNLKNIPNIGLNIIKDINEELTTRENNINSENLNKITTLIKNEINNCFDIETYTMGNEEEEEEDEGDADEDDTEIRPKKKYNYKYYQIDEKLFKKMLKDNEIKEYIYLVINSIDVDFIKEKIYSLLELSENKSEFMQKISNVILSSIEQSILTTLGKILPLKNTNEILFLFYMGKMCQHLLDTVSKMIEENDKEKLLLDINNCIYDIIDKNLSFIIEDVSTYNQNIDKFILKNTLLRQVYGQIPLFLLCKNFNEKIEKYEVDFIESFGKIRSQKIKDELTFDNLRNLDNFSYEYQKMINIVFSFSEESLNQDEEIKIQNLKNHILLDVDLNQKKDEPKEINLIEIPIISENKNETKKCKLMTTTLDIITDSLYAVKLLLYFNKNNYNQILCYLYEIFNNFINLSNDIVLETKGQIKTITQNELGASYSSVFLIREITAKILLFLNSSKDINEETKKKYNDLESSSKDYLEKNILKLNIMIQSGVNESSLDEFKKIIGSEKYPIDKGHLSINPFAENLVKLVKNVNKSLKDCYEDKIKSKIILDNLNDYNNELEKLLEKKELNDEDEKTQFKKDFIFIRKNIDKNIDDIDFKGFKKRLNNIYKKLLPKEKGE